ncbi:class I adenylate-forming enzyme family protein [Rhodococcus sp. BH4]|uniref:class I adenylate-forming enzyme family protein n=1 Tax=Rhodococcus sp. BH4 TaxID=1807790 RepID=UPI001E5A4C4B|nr:AMP-binding protein [Rhodococcus sp. BH4]
MESQAEVARRYVSEGWWDGSTLPSLLRDAIARSGSNRFSVHSALREWHGQLDDVVRLGLRLAGGLSRIGVRPGDRVAFQLPNCVESAATFYGLALMGAVLVPIDNAYASRELEFILRSCNARTLVVADRVGTRIPLEEVNSIRGRLPSLENVVVVGTDPIPAGAVRFNQLAAGDPWRERVDVDPAAAAVIGWTSGTTASPKGVVLSHRALSAEVRLHMAPFLSHRTRPLASTSPISHVTGMLVSVLVPPIIGHEIHLLDAWDPDFVLGLMIREQVSAGTGVPLFLSSLLDHPRISAEHLKLIEMSQLGGASVPPDLVRRADALGINVMRGYGCTEHSSVSLGRPDQPLEQRATTDGLPCPGVEVRIVDDTGVDLGAGTPGNILTRGPDLFSGYTDAKLTIEAFQDLTWFRTGDIGFIDHQGCLSVIGRAKDIIIRAGLNISAAEVESVLVEMDGVIDAAVVAEEDARTGERACAFLRIAPHTNAPTLESIRGFLARTGMAKYKWPEAIRLVDDDFPRTPAGKVRKNILRDSLKA